MMKRPTIITVLTLLIAAFAAAGQAEISVNLNLDRSEAALADTIRMVVTISGTRDTQSRPLIKGLDHFTVTQGGTSSRVEIINGKVDSSVDYTYYLQAKKTGAFQIGPAQVHVGGKRYQSRVQSIHIVKTAASRGSTQGSTHDALFLTAEISSQKVYLEQQTLYTLKLYSRKNIKDISLSLPEQDQLVFKQLGKPREYRAMVGGQRYDVLEVRYAVVSNATGSFVIKPTRMNMTVLTPRNRRLGNLFDDSFFQDPFFSLSSGRPVTLSSESLPLTVIPLPDAGKPDGFSGLVGRFSIDAQLEPAAVKAGESATVTVRVKGQGNVQRIPDLKFPELKDTKIYADQPVLKTEATDHGLEGTKTMKWALVPEKPGRVEIPPMALSYFDSETKRYRTLETASHLLSVSLSDKKHASISAPSPQAKKSNKKVGKHKVEALGHDILPIHTGMRNLSAPSFFLKNGMFFWGMLLGPFLFYAAGFLALKHRRRKIESLPKMRSKKAAGEFAKQCRKDSLSHQALMDALRDYLNRRFSLSLGVVTVEEAVGILRSRGVKSACAERFRSTLQQLEDAIYTGRGHERTDCAKELSELIRAIEKEIR